MADATGIAVRGGGCYVVDNLRDLDRAVAVGSGYFIYHGRSDSYSARYCHYSGVGKCHFRAEGPVGAQSRH